MKSSLNILLFAFTIVSFSFFSCSNEQELKIESSEIDLLVSFVDEANSIAQHYDELTGPKGSEIFGNNKSAVCGNEHVFIGPCIWAIDDIVEALGYEDISNVNSWMMESGSILYDIKKRNKDWDTQKELIIEIACRVAPEIQTRSQEASCYKDNLVALFSGALNAGNSNATFNINNETLERDKMYEVGSSFYKVWRYMVNMHNCE